MKILREAIQHPLEEPQAARLPRRNFLRLIGGSAALQAAPEARSDAYPSRPVRIVVGFPPGGASDITARLIGHSLAERLGQPFVVENRPGASANIAAESVVRAPADGYTLLLVASANAINSSFYQGLTFDFAHDIAAVAAILRGPLVMVVNVAFPSADVAEFIARARANPGKINMASPGNGTSPHVAGELFKMTTGVDMLHVPFRGGSVPLTELMAGRVDVLFATIPSSIELIRAGKIRALGVTTETRSSALPDVPCIADTVRGYEASDWYGIGAPRATPLPIVSRLNREVNAVLAEPRVRSRIDDMGAVPIESTPAAFEKMIVDETRKWSAVVKFAGARSG